MESARTPHQQIAHNVDFIICSNKQTAPGVESYADLYARNQINEKVVVTTSPHPINIGSSDLEKYDNGL
jgi:hypothetical protein